LNLQVAFEVVKIQPVAGALGTIRVVPSQQQRPAMGGMPSFAVAGLQVVPNSETAPVQLTPSLQGHASVFITVPFQISTLQFSPTLEIGSVTLKFKFEAGCCPVARDRTWSSGRRANVRDR
jgi:hypothetical protein